MSLKKKQFLAISLAFFLAGWMGGFIVAVDKEHVSFFQAFFAVNPYRGAMATVLVGWFLVVILTKVSEDRFHWIWNTILSPILMVLAIQVHFLIWPEWHGRSESYKTTVLFINSFWTWMLPISLVTMHSLGFLFRYWNLDDLVEAVLIKDDSEQNENISDIDSSPKMR